MAHAFLFDNQDSYVQFVEAVKAVVTSPVLKETDSVYIVRWGDLLFGQAAQDVPDLFKLALSAVGAAGDVQLRGEEFAECLIQRLVFCVVVEGTDEGEATRIHENLQFSSSYLGYHPVSYSFEIQLQFYRNLLSRKLRIHNNKLEIFYTGGDVENIDPMWIEKLGGHFQITSNQDDGFHGTFLDEFDTVEHFSRVEACKKGLTRLFGSKKANNSILLIEDINPKLSDNVFSAIRAIENLETTEDAAQASLSVRRFVEALADTLFPARETAEGERRLDQAAYRNRIWQYIANAYQHNPAQIEKLGKELDRVDKIANKGIHHHISREGVQQVVDDILSLTSAITDSSLADLRRSGYPFRKSIQTFVKELSKKIDA
ncbi:hypothetical protein ACFFLM_08695 [Deinococcus oregonensis]|uniref:Apea-like HEPN domain-containing protein n=1 Tax=Deinococcus oregonensis TaxID=1805970 RepID=A0ABV6AZH5_9DEIO